MGRKVQRGSPPASRPKCKRGSHKSPFFRFVTLVPDQFGISAGTMVTIDGNTQRIAMPTTWISTNGMMPR